MIRRGFVDMEFRHGNTPAHCCRECDFMTEKHVKESCGDGMGGHGWTEIFYLCSEMTGDDKECPGPGEERFCPKKQKLKEGE